MVLKLYNSLTKTVETFKPIKDGVVRMYNCGPTVYSYAHIGNFRYFAVVDLLRRHLESNHNLKVEQVINITDVGHLTDDADDGEDKMLKAAEKEKKDPYEIAKFYTDAFIADSNALNLLEPKARPKATEYIKEIIEIIQVLMEKGYAYKSGENVYFDIEKFQDYGKLSGNTLEKLNNNRVDKDPNKKNNQDFVLWFGKSKFENHIMEWDSPWGKGYPGWHIECSIMSAKELTNAFKNEEHKFKPENFETIDIHTGGEDNRFPHHECEIAQTECATGKKFSNYWLHVRHLMIEGQKISKSLGNVYYVFELIEKGYSPESIRYNLISSQYRQQVNFTLKGLTDAQIAIDKVVNLLQKLVKISDEKKEKSNKWNNIVPNFVESLDDDLNISKALAVMFEFVNEINKELMENNISSENANEIINIFKQLNKTLAVIPKSAFTGKTLGEHESKLLESWKEKIKSKQFEAADKIREQLFKLGISPNYNKQTDAVEWERKLN